MIMLKRFKDPLDHAVLEKQRLLKPRNFAHMGDRDPELLRLPPDPLPGANDAGGYTADRAEVLRFRRLQFQVDA
jgi:hypothetical protein